MPDDANHRQFRKLNSTLTETGRDILQRSVEFCCVSTATRWDTVLSGSADTDVSISVEDLGSQWMGPTLRPRLRARPCAHLGIPTNMMNPTCGTLCWDFSVMCKLAYFWSRTLMRIALSCHFAFDLLCDKAELCYSPFLRLAFTTAWLVVSLHLFLLLVNGQFFVGTYQIFLSRDDLLNETSQFHTACEWFGPGWTGFVATGPCCPTSDLGFIGRFARVTMEFGRKRVSPTSSALYDSFKMIATPAETMERSFHPAMTDR